jgi:aminotransferase class I and II
VTEKTSFPHLQDSALTDLPRRYISNIEWAGGKCVYVPISPPKDGATRNTKSSEWLIDFDRLEAAVGPKTKLMIVNSPSEYPSTRRIAGITTDTHQTTPTARS